VVTKPATEEEFGEIEGEYQVGFTTILGSKVGLAMFLAIFFAFVQYLFFAPTLSPYLIETFQTTDANTNLFFLFCTGFDAAGAPLMGWLNTKVDPLKMVGFGLFLYPIGIIFLGPSLVLGFPEEKSLVIAGLCILGLALATVLVPSVNIMIEAGLIKAEEERIKLELPA